MSVDSAVLATFIVSVFFIALVLIRQAIVSIRRRRFKRFKRRKGGWK